nr:hypothetical protein [Tanacetum cinerariifolium]
MIRLWRERWLVLPRRLLTLVRISSFQVKFCKLLSVIISVITDIRCVLTQDALDTFCNMFHILEEVHPILPNQVDTMHEKPTGKIRLYTRFFDFANFRLPLSTFVVDILRPIRINISQLSVIRAAKVSHFEILCRVYRILPTVGLFWCFYVNSKKSGYDFACLASFPWHTAKHMVRDPVPGAADFSGQDYATFVVHPSPFRKFLEPFMCLVGLSRHYTLDEETYTRFVHKNEEGGCILLYLCYVFYGLVVLLLTVLSFFVDIDLFAFIHAPDPTKVRVAEREREVDEPRLLDAIVGRTIPLLSVAPDRANNELEASVERLFDKGASHPPKKLREDHGTPSGTFVGGKSQSSLQRLLAGAVLNVEVEEEGHTDSVVEPNLRTIRSPQRFVISSDSSHHSGPTIAEAKVDSLVSSLSAKVRMQAKYNVKKKRRLKSVVEEKDELLNARDELIENLKAHMLLKEAKAAKAIRLHAEASNVETVKKSIRDEVSALKERNTILAKERNALDVKVMDLETSVVGKERDLTGLNAQLTSIKSQNDALVDQVHELELSSSRLQEKATVYENCMGRLKKFQDDQMKAINDKFDKLYTDFVEMALHLEDKFYLHILATISGRRWLLTQGVELVITKYLNLPEYHSALGTAIGKFIEKGMQDELSIGITHGKKGRILTDVAAYNPSVEVDYISALQQLQNLNFSLLAEMKSHKDASIKAPFSVAVLTGTEDTSNVMPATIDTTTALSITFASASTIVPIFIDDYEVVGTDDQTDADVNA